MAVPVDPHTVALTWDPPESSNGVITTYIILYNVDLNMNETTWNKTERSGKAIGPTIH